MVTPQERHNAIYAVRAKLTPYEGPIGDKWVLPEKGGTDEKVYGAFKIPWSSVRLGGVDGCDVSLEPHHRDG